MRLPRPFTCTRNDRLLRFAIAARHDLGSARQVNCERCSHAHPALYFNAAIMALYDLFADRKNKTCARSFAFMFVHTKEFLKEMGNRFFRDAQPSILDSDGFFRFTEIA